MVTRSKSVPAGRPYTLSETKFNFDLREILRLTAGFSALHVREADLPGVLDLLVTEKAIAGNLPRPLRFLWAELKVDDEEVRPSQVTFMRQRRELGEMTFVIRLTKDYAVTIATLSDTQVKFTEHHWIEDFRTHNWDVTLKYYLDLHFS